VGVLNDISGVFQDTNGPGSVMAARMAAEDFAGGGRGIRVEIVQGDHQNRADVGSALVRRWLDVDRVDAVVDVPNSAVGLAVNTLLRDSRAALLASSTATSELTGAQCSPNTVQWVTDTWAIANSTAAGVMQRGGDSWYFLTVDYALGHGIVRDSTAFIEARGGRVLGGARHPLGHQRPVLPAAPGALLAREDRGARQRRRGHDQRREAGGGVRRRPALRPVAGGDARLHQRRPRHGACARRRACC
jgi:branched-chain amino acid transport system substrate-binding protein